MGITGWSYGGYLAALAVLQRPDVFHAAVAGAPVTEWRLYDTCYTERYLGHPDEVPEVYDANSLLPLAPRLERPLMLIHGLADDNELVVRAACTYSHSGEGLHRFVNPVDDRVYLYSQFEVPDARRVFATFEQPDLKSVFTFRVTAEGEARETALSEVTFDTPQEATP